MKTISVSVSESDYEEFRRAAQSTGRPIAQLIREAMRHYREDQLEKRSRLIELPVLLGHSSSGALPRRDELYEEMFEPS